MRRATLFPTVILSALLTSCALAQAPPGAAVPLASVNLNEARLRVHFIDIGPGMAALIETPGGVHVFVDGGKWGLADMITYLERFVGADNSVVDIAIVTHPDFDHFAGMRKVFTKYSVQQFWYTGYDSAALSPSWATFTQEVQQEEDCQVYWPLKEYNDVGDFEIIDDGGTENDSSDDVVIQYLNVDSDPPEQDAIFGRSFSESERRNNASFVFKVIYGDVSFLFTGDINGRDREHTHESTDSEIDSEELELWARHHLLPATCGLGATVLQISHHGSNGSSSLPFLQAVAPTWVVIPAGHQYNHPAPETLRRISAAGVANNHVLRTDDGDSTPERSHRDPRGDDSFVFETDGTTITRVLRVRVN